MFSDLEDYGLDPQTMNAIRRPQPSNDPMDELRYAKMIPQDSLAERTISDALNDPRTQWSMQQLQARPEEVPVYTGGLLNKTSAWGLTTPPSINDKSKSDKPRLNRLEDAFIQRAKSRSAIFLQSDIPMSEGQRILDRLNIPERVTSPEQARALVLAHEAGHALANLSEANQNLVRSTSGRGYDEEAVADLLGIQGDSLDRVNVNPSLFYRYLNMIVRPQPKAE